MRLAAVEKMGYYPTPSEVVRLIAGWLLPPDSPYRVLDPCCGEGDAVSELVSLIGGQAETWGVELSPVRAGQAAKRMNRVVQGDWFQVTVTPKSISLLYLNPPYDFTPGDRRMEISFLRSSADLLVPGGVLVFIVPQQLLGYEAAGLLTGYFDGLVVRRFPDEYQRFRQVVVFGIRRNKYQKPSADTLNTFRSLADSDLPVLGEPESPWPAVIPPAGKAKMVLAELSNHDLICRAAGLGWPPELLDALDCSESRTDIVPAMPLRKGHVAMLMSSGLMGTIRIRKADGETVLLKGQVVKQQVTRSEEKDGDKVQVVKDRFQTAIGIVDRNGVQIVDDVEGVIALMEKWGEDIARSILARTPLYNLDPTPEEWSRVSLLGKNREKLPGQDAPGLLEPQAHAAIAMARAARRYGHALVQGAMGVGKTTISLAAVELLDEYPVLVICPPHLVGKWYREVQEVIPDAVAVELKSLLDLQQFIAAYQSGLVGRKAVAVVASTTAKLGGGWKGAAAVARGLPKDPKDRGGWRAALARYKAEREKLLEMTGDEQRERVSQARKAALEQAEAIPVCPHCGQVVMTNKGHLVSFGDLDRKPHKCSNCGTPLYDFGHRYRRWPLAEYISAKCRGFFRVLIADEAHEYKGKDSDRGLAFHKLVNATKYQLALTGTFFGGKSTSIFWLLHRLRMGAVHRDFSYTDEMRWARRYGVLETRIWNGGDSDSDVYGVYTANARRKVTVSELPGVSPAILERILPATIFLSLADLGVALPPYNEEVALLEMEPVAMEQYQAMFGSLKNLAVQDRRLLSLWLQWSLARPNSGFRDEVVVREIRDPDGNIIACEQLMLLPRVVDGRLLPKESWLVNFASAEIKAGRKVIVYIRQSGTRDIQPRIKEILEQAGLRTAILYSSVDPRKREDWIRKQAPLVDVLVVNPGIVATGLDLVEFATIVYYEIEYSLYTMWQAMSRVWRLRQTKPVKVVFACYSGVLEEQALSLQGRKMKAAQLIYGQQVEGAIVPEEDGDFLTELARTVLEGCDLPDLQLLFAVRRAETTSPLGCPTAESVRIVQSQSQLSQPLTRRKRALVPPGQLTLPGL